MDKREKMFSLVDQYRKSGLSMRLFAQTHELKLSTFTYWVRKKRKTEQQQDTGQFIVVDPQSGAVDSRTRVELIYPNGVRLRLPHPDKQQIEQLIKIY